MKTIIILLTVLLCGCQTVYTYKAGNQELTIKSYREFPQGIRVQYTEGEGFIVESAAVTNSGDVKAMSDLMLQMLPLIAPVPGN
jgi:hypothetical protein